MNKNVHRRINFNSNLISKLFMGSAFFSFVI